PAGRASRRRSWPCLRELRAGAVHRDVAERGASTDLDRRVPGAWAVGGFQLVADLAELRVQVEPCRDAVCDADVDAAEGGLGDDGAVPHRAEEDVAVRGLGLDRGPRPVDGDPAVRRIRAQLAGDVSDPGV